MYNFTYHRASGLRQAQTLLGKLDDPKLLAGGMTLLPTMKMRLASPPNPIDLHPGEGGAGDAGERPPLGIRAPAPPGAAGGGPEAWAPRGGRPAGGGGARAGPMPTGRIPPGWARRSRRWP